MNIGIIFGGKSFEHDISIISAYQLKKKIEKKYKINMIYVDFNSNLYITDKCSLNDFKNNNLKKKKKTMFVSGGIKYIDIDVLVSVMHGENGEDGIIASMARFYDIPFMGCSTFSGSLCIDKYNTYRYLSSNGIDMVDTILYTYEDYLNNKEINIIPCIIKPCCLGSSLGINVCKDKNDLDDLLVDSFKYSNRLVIQPFYEGILEYNLALNESYYSNLETINKKEDIFSFENKYSDSFKQLHQSLINNDRYDEFCCVARKVYDLICGNGIIRIDFFIHEDKILVNEVNTTPGALAMYLFADFDVVFDESLRRVIDKEYVEYVKGDFLSSSNINK